MEGTSAMSEIQPPLRYADGLWLLDTQFRGETGVIACYLLTGNTGLALIDTGPGATVGAVLAGIRAAGFDPREVRHLVLTHVHLDHAGAAGALIRMMPGATVHVHALSACHLIDPSKLLASARRIYGERTGALWGDVEPVPADRLVVVEDGDQLRMGGRTLRVIYTPGHAVHHVAYHDIEGDELFPGDVAGVRLTGTRLVRPPTPPPDLNIEDWDRSLNRIAALAPRVLFLPHFGRFTDVERHLGELRERLHAWSARMLAGMRAGKGEAELADTLTQAPLRDIASMPEHERESTLRRFEIAANLLMSVQGFMRYFTKVHPELLGA